MRSINQHTLLHVQNTLLCWLYFHDILQEKDAICQTRSTLSHNVPCCSDHSLTWYRCRRWDSASTSSVPPDKFQHFSRQYIYFLLVLVFFCTWLFDWNLRKMNRAIHTHPRAVTREPNSSVELSHTFSYSILQGTVVQNVLQRFHPQNVSDELLGWDSPQVGCRHWRSRNLFFTIQFALHSQFLVFPICVSTFPKWDDRLHSGACVELKASLYKPFPSKFKPTFSQPTTAVSLEYSSSMQQVSPSASPSFLRPSQSGMWHESVILNNAAGNERRGTHQSPQDGRFSSDSCVWAGKGGPANDEMNGGRLHQDAADGRGRSVFRPGFKSWKPPHRRLDGEKRIPLEQEWLDHKTVLLCIFKQPCPERARSVQIIQIGNHGNSPEPVLRDGCGVGGLHQPPLGGTLRSWCWDAVQLWRSLLDCWNMEEFLPPPPPPPCLSKLWRNFKFRTSTQPVSWVLLDFCGQKLSVQSVFERSQGMLWMPFDSTKLLIIS